jgi:hypothetical protein
MRFFPHFGQVVFSRLESVIGGSMLSYVPLAPAPPALGEVIASAEISASQFGQLPGG